MSMQAEGERRNAELEKTSMEIFGITRKMTPDQYKEAKTSVLDAREPTVRPENEEAAKLESLLEASLRIMCDVRTGDGLRDAAQKVSGWTSDLLGMKTAEEMIKFMSNRKWIQ